MAGEPQFTIGARASCTDGHCDEVRRLIIDPATETVTHLVIQPGHRQQAGRLVPVHLYAKAGQVIDLLEHRADRPSREFLEWHLDEIFLKPAAT
jgi:hypothetical protein